MLWPPDAENWLIGEDPNAGKDWRQEEKETTEDEMEGLMLRLKLQYFGHLMQRTDSLEKTLMLGKIEGRRRSGR